MDVTDFAPNVSATSLVTSAAGSKVPSFQPRQPTYFHSRRIKKGTVQKPWLDEKKDPREVWANRLPLIGILIGTLLAGVLIWDGYSQIQYHKYCMVYNHTFADGWDSKVWTKEVEVGGFGNGQFEETTSTDENVFIQDDILVIKPTLQDINLMTHNTTLNLTKLGTCTSDIWYNCVVTTNTTNGTVINPAKSGRINTKAGASIKYGKVEVVAKMPAGDWLWPAIWMLPVDNTYGPWPASGEIDLFESRGNNYTYPLGGNNVMSSTLHWGPDTEYDQYWRFQKFETAPHSTWHDQFHLFGLEWTPEYLYTYIDSQLWQVAYVKFVEPLWKKGNFPPATANGTGLIDPWSQTGRANTPFDQPFYLILDVAVGGTNGWFQDGVAGKPWVDESPEAKLDFWNARDQWYPTWKRGGQMEVKSVTMWQQNGYMGCKV